VVELLRREIEREAELRAYAVLGSEDIPALERIADLAAAMSGMAVAEVNVVAGGDVVHVATTNRDHLRVPREHSFCSTIIERLSPTSVVIDATTELPFARSPYVTGEKASIRSYASAHLVAPGGAVLGTLCVFDAERREVTTDQLAALADLAALVMEVLEMRRTSRELAGTLERLAGSHHRLDTANESLEAFAGQISHDLQSPLTAVRVALELMDDEGGLGEDVQSLLDHALSGGLRMQRTITDLLDFAVAGVPAPATRIDLHAVVDSVLADLGWALAGAEVEVQPLLALLGDETEIRSVVQNLIANAVKFAAPYGTPHVVVRSESREGSTVRVLVVDNGPGVPEHERSAVFGLNVRGSSSVEGHGIGLATCARIIRSRGGAIGVDPSPGGGAQFWFELPAAV
jgi:signal transduction histidine kinase